MTTREILIAHGMLIPADELTTTRATPDVPRLQLDEAARKAIAQGRPFAIEPFLAAIERWRMR